MINLSLPFIRRPKATLLVMGAMVAVGVLAYFQLPVSSLPDVEFPTINVYASLPGATAETMASAVASPLERALAVVPGVTGMASSSSLGQVGIVIQFELSRDIDAAAQDVQAAINAAAGQLPKDLPNPPAYRKVNPNGFSVLTLDAVSDTLPLTRVFELVDTVVAPVIAQLPGVGQVDYHGDQVPAIRLQIDPAALSAHGLDLEDVRLGISSATANSPKGTLDSPSRSQLVESNDQLAVGADFDRQIVAWRGGAPIRLRDVGRALDSVQEAKTAAWSQARRAIIIDVHKQTGARVDVPRLVGQIRKLMPELSLALPPTVKLGVVGDRTITTQASVRDVEMTLAITIGLVALVIFAFLRDVPATLIAAASIPLSLIGAFPAMYALGFSLDNISLMGLTIAVGFVVDDAIVVLENIVRHREMGTPPLEAAIEGAGEVGFTVISMTVSLIAVFIPLLLMTGVVGRLFREFAITVSVALVVSAIVSLTQTAVACRLFLRDGGHRTPSRAGRAAERCLDSARLYYKGGLDWMLRHRRIGLALTLILTAASAWLFIILPKGFIPEQDGGFISATTEASPEIGFAEMMRKQLQLAEIVLADPDVANAYSFVEPRPAANLGRVQIILRPTAEGRSSATAVMARLRPRLAAVPGIRVYLKAVQDVAIGVGFSKTLYQFVLQDSDVTELYASAQKYRQMLAGLPQLQDVGSDLSALAPSVRVVVDRDQAASLGISAANVDQILYDAFGQRQITTLFSQFSQHKVILEVQPNARLDAEGLAALRIRSPLTGRQVPLGAIAHLESGKAPLTIGHLGLFPAATLSFNLAPGASLGDAVSAIRAAEAPLHRPGLRTSFQGSTQAFQDSLATQPWLILAAVAAVYVVLGVLYESFLHPLTILSSLPSAAFGALLAMAMFRIELSVVTLIALILLIGIVKKNAIMMVDVALTLQRAGETAEHAIVTACWLRFRPITMTTLAAFLGAIPLAVGTGAGSELRRPLGIAVAGGLLVSQCVTLYTVPVVYLYLARVAAWFERRKPRRTDVSRSGSLQGFRADPPRSKLT
jgi:multidrug efflux pump